MFPVVVSCVDPPSTLTLGVNLETIVALQVREAPEHSVLPRASNYDVRELNFTWAEGDARAVLDLTASTHEDLVRLRFTGVENLHVGAGTSSLCNIRLQIQDTSQCPSKSHYIPPVRVGGADPNGCGLSFWAHSVERL